MMDTPDYIPNDYTGIKVVGSLSEVFNTPFGPANAVVFPRKLTADFNALARGLKEQLHITNKGRQQHTLSYHELAVRAQSMNAAAQEAVAVVLADMKEMESLGLKAKLRVVSPAGYKFRIAHHFHEDIEKPTALGRILCCYNDPVTDWLRNEDAVRVSGQRYEARDSALIQSFRTGDIWKQMPRNSLGIPPFIHRAGYDPHSDMPRLVLAAD
jgi:hypothetical protein